MGKNVKTCSVSLDCCISCCLMLFIIQSLHEYRFLWIQFKRSSLKLTGAIYTWFRTYENLNVFALKISLSSLPNIKLLYCSRGWEEHFWGNYTYRIGLLGWKAHTEVWLEQKIPTVKSPQIRVINSKSWTKYGKLCTSKTNTCLRLYTQPLGLQLNHNLQISEEYRRRKILTPMRIRTQKNQVLRM